MMGYYFILGDGGRTVIMDSHINVLIENMIRIAGRQMGILVSICFLLFSVLWIIFLKGKRVRSKFLTISAIGMALFFLLNSWQQPYYSNVISDGNENKADFIALGNYLGEELEEYALFYGYIAQDYMWVRPEEMDGISSGGIVVLKRGHSSCR